MIPSPPNRRVATAAVSVGRIGQLFFSFTIWSSIVHACIMAAQAIQDTHEIGHLVGDVPALLLVAAVLWYFSPASERQGVPA